MTEEQIQAQLKDYEAKLRRYADTMRNAPESLSGMQRISYAERNYDKIFNNNRDLVKIALAEHEEKSKKKTCPVCGTQLRFRENRKKTIIGLKGPYTLNRPYFFCKGCNKAGYFEDEKAIRFGKYSTELLEKICLLGSHVPARTCADLLHRLCDIKVSVTTVKDALRHIGTVLFEKEEAACQVNSLNFDFSSPEVQKILKNRAYLELDGCMLNSVEGWKENKLATIYSEADVEKRGDEKNRRASIRLKTLVSSFAKGVEDFEKRVAHWLQRTQKIFARELIVISDGAVWIENMVKRVAKKAIHILDWYHAKEKIYNCAKAIYGEFSPKVAEWAEPLCDLLWNGQAEALVATLEVKARTSRKQTPLYELRNYFAERLHMLRYDEFRAKGYTIGSGAIESANKYAIQDRLKKSGMRWSIRGANAVAKLRTLYLSGLWDTEWAAA